MAGTALQWFAGNGPGHAHSNDRQPDIIVDFSGDLAPPWNVPVWRIVDAAGGSILAPFAAIESCHRAPYVASIFLIEHRPGRDGWRVLEDAYLPSRVGYRDLLNHVGQTAGRLLSARLRRLDRTGRAGRVFTPIVPRKRSVMAHKTRIACASLAVHWQARLATELWAVGIIDRPFYGTAGDGLAGNLLADRTLAPDRWLEWPARQGFIADPFPWPGRPGTILCERYLFENRRGAIVALSTDGPATESVRPVAFEVSTHLSYPFSWNDGARVLCLPEMAEGGKAILFELPDGGGPARPICDIAVDGGAVDGGAVDGGLVDPSFFETDGLCWIAYTDPAVGSHDNLCLLYADCPEGPWTPHPMNPVKIDIRSSRPGGMPFRIGGALYRPAQDCSRTYGGALVINRVLACTPTEYMEDSVARIAPDPDGPYPDGLHSLSFEAGITLMDGKRLAFDWGMIFRRLAKRITRMMA